MIVKFKEFNKYVTKSRDLKRYESIAQIYWLDYNLVTR